MTSIADALNLPEWQVDVYRSHEYLVAPYISALEELAKEHSKPFNVTKTVVQHPKEPLLVIGIRAPGSEDYTHRFYGVDNTPIPPPVLVMPPHEKEHQSYLDGIRNLLNKRQRNRYDAPYSRPGAAVRARTRP